MKAKNRIPQRTCLACRTMKNKNSMQRIVKTPEGRIIVDKSGKADGRGAYVCHDTECIKKLIKTRALNRAFKCEVSRDIYDNINNEQNKN